MQARRAAQDTMAQALATQARGRHLGPGNGVLREALRTRISIFGPKIKRADDPRRTALGLWPPSAAALYTSSLAVRPSATCFNVYGLHFSEPSFCQNFWRAAAHLAPRSRPRCIMLHPPTH